MNCELGDLAVVVKHIVASNENTSERFVLVKPGTVVRCVSFDPMIDGWNLEQKIPFSVCFADGSWIRGDINGIGDCALRPLRDPGDDAVDEMVLRVGKPEEGTA